MSDAADFTGTKRYEVIRRLGKGSFGVVFEVYDRLRQERVALKTLRIVDGDSVYYLKKEFRTVADINHKNLLSLYELAVSEGLWFFTMELVEKTDFIGFIRGSPLDSVHHENSECWNKTTVRDRDSSQLDALLETSTEARPAPLRAPPPDEDKLRVALSQVVRGTMALHRAGVVHRDIKPSNILSTCDGVIKIADFGLSVRRTFERDLGGLAGTPGYIAPECVTTSKVTPASDWYSIGVILYEVFTGRLPYKGGGRSLVTNAVIGQAPHVRQLVPDAPGDLSALCMELIARSPSKRPTGEEILRRLDTGGPSRALVRASASVTGEQLIGRAEELEVLRRAGEAARGGSTVVLRLLGRPGVGKSALVDHFLRGCEADDQTVVLRGRCFERESVPYRAVDSLMDSLSSYLCSLDTSTLAALTPREVLPLVRVFPVMGRVEALTAASSDRIDVPDRQELRRRAFCGLRELLCRLTDLFPVILWLDDLQWSDRDSAALLAELFSPPDPPRLLLIASYRHIGRGLSPELDHALASTSVAGRVEQVELGNLAPEDAYRLSRARMGPEASDEMVEAVAREAEGNPFFIIMLAAHQLEQGAPLDEHLTLEQVIESRVRSLTPEARRLLSIASLSCRQPLPLAVAREAAGLETGLSEAQVQLRARLMLNSWVGDSGEALQLSHDRIREGVIAGLSAEERRDHHLRLARALEACAPPDPEALASHLVEAGEGESAAQALVLAAGLAAEKLAFDRAAHLYGQALKLGELRWSEERRLRVLHGDALRNAGRGPEAAREYLAAITGAVPAEAVELRRRAVEQLLLSGHTDEGRRLMRQLLRDQGIEPSRSRPGLLTDIVLSQLWVRLVDLRLSERRASSISEEAKQRLDVTWSTTWGLSLIEPVEARALQGRHLRDALKVGEPFRLARALLLELGLATTLGELRGTGRASLLLDQGRALVERLDHPYTNGLWMLVKGMRLFFSHRFSEALHECDQASAYLLANTTGATAELMTLRLFAVCSLYYLGDFEQLSQRVRAAVRTTRAAGDLVGLASMCGGVPLVAWLAKDDLEAARQALEESRRQLGSNRFAHGDYWSLFGEGFLALYAGEPVEGYRRLRSRWRGFTRSGIHLAPTTIVPTLHLRGSLAVAAAAGGRRQRSHRDALRCAKKLDGYAWLLGAAAMAALIRAAVEYQRGRNFAALELLEAAEEESRRAEMAWYAEVARLRRGAVLGGSTGALVEQKALEALERRGIARADTFARLIAPGFPEPRAKPRAPDLFERVGRQRQVARARGSRR